MKKKIVYVMGVQRSGTRMMTNWLVCSGFDGVSDTNSGIYRRAQDVPLQVLRRMPTGRKDLDYSLLFKQMRNKGFEVCAIVMMRDGFCMSDALTERDFSPDEETACDNIRDRYADIFQGLAQYKVPTVLVTYESIQHNQEYVRKWLSKWLGHELTDFFVFVDSNRLHFEKLDEETPDSF